MLMNARTEMVAAARRQQAAKHFPDGCTAALALPEASADGVAAARPELGLAGGVRRDRRGPAHSAAMMGPTS